MDQIIKGVKLRLYPNRGQKDKLWQMFGNDRFVWKRHVIKITPGRLSLTATEWTLF